MTNQLHIEWLGGNCPVQAEGTIGGKRFYFRARGEHWRMEIHPSADTPYIDWPEDGLEWCREQEWGNGPFEAGWMPEEEARRLIEQCAADYVAGKPGETTP